LSFFNFNINTNGNNFEKVKQIQIRVKILLEKILPNLFYIFNIKESLLKKIAYNAKLVNIFFILNANMFQLISKEHISVEDGSAVVLEWPLKTTYNDVNNKKTYLSIHYNIRFHRFSVFSFSHFSVF
jgi:hypothetical protein